MIDTHCHLLWRLDDGPRTAAQAIELARTLVRQAVVAALCTPHYSSRFPVGIETARERFEELQRDLAELQIPLQTALAAEVARPLALRGSIEQLQERSVGGFLVVEVDPAASADVPLRILERVLPFGLRPIFAHPERAHAIRADGRALDEARAEGALVQVVLSSLSGRRGAAAARGGWALLEEGRVDLVATDAHNALGSIRRLREILALVTSRYGRESTERLTVSAPASVLQLGAS